MRCRSAMRRLRIRARGTSKHYLGGRGYFMPLALCISDRKRDLMNSSPSFLLVAISAAFSPVRPQQNEVYLRFSPRRSAKRASPLCSRWQRRFASSPRGPVGAFVGVLSTLVGGPARERSPLKPRRAVRDCFSRPSGPSKTQFCLLTARPRWGFYCGSLCLVSSFADAARVGQSPQVPRALP